MVKDLCLSMALPNLAFTVQCSVTFDRMFFFDSVGPKLYFTVTVPIFWTPGLPDDVHSNRPWLFVRLSV